MSTEKKTILIVDDHPLMRAAIKNCLEGHPDLSVCGEAETPAQVLEAVARQRPDGVIMDLALGSYSGLELLKQLKSLHPGLLVLVISNHDEMIYAERALSAGANGYIMKTKGADELVAALRVVLAGDIALSRQASARLLRQAVGREVPRMDGPAGARLSDREIHVLRLLGVGLGTRVIAEQLHLSVKTVETYRERLKVKLGLADGTALLFRARTWVEQGG